MLNEKLSVTAASFYGKGSHSAQVSLRDREIRVQQRPRYTFKEEKFVEKYPFKYLNPESPSSAWGIFRKQIDAIEDAKRRRNGVIPFVCQSGACGQRYFFVADPRVFWFYDCRKSSQRCSYEIIAENAPCKLYFDLEFLKELNPHHNGTRMVDRFLKFVSFFLKKEWRIECTRKDVLDLDSSTDKKFSRHLIYQLPSIVFQNNYHVGNFVRMICSTLRSFKNNCGNANVDAIGISHCDISELFVDNNGKEQLFCDEGVYTKNRHFRLYCSSKWNKNAPLLRSNENTWLNSEVIGSEEIFLDSLITYIPQNLHNTMLEYGDNANIPIINSFTDTRLQSCNNSYKTSPFPNVHKFIQQLVTPGKIYRWHYSLHQNCLYYDIVGNRFCKNVGRQHRSNNISFVVDLKSKTFYQKCYDPDCKGYSSGKIPLSSELLFTLEGSIQFKNSEEYETVWQDDFPEETLSEVVDWIENCFVSENLL